MYHVAPQQSKAGISSKDYYKLPPRVETEGKVPDITPEGEDENAPPGFLLHRVEYGDNLVALSLRYNVSQARLRKYNRECCFGKNLAHVTGKYLLIPTTSESALTDEVQEMLAQAQQNAAPLDPLTLTEEGKYELRRAFSYHTKNQVDAFRIDYYLGEANWNLRGAIKIFEEDRQWEIRRLLAKKLEITDQAADELLRVNGGDPQLAEQYWHAHNATPPQNEPDVVFRTGREMTDLKRRLVREQDGATTSTSVQTIGRQPCCGGCDEPVNRGHAVVAQ